jgi:hypothetical protein
LTKEARLGRQDKAGVPAVGPSVLTVCLHIVFCPVRAAPLRGGCGAHATFSFVFNAPSAITRDERRRKPCRAYAGASLSTLRHDDRISSLVGSFRLPIIVSWRTTKKTTSASVPARSATVVAGLETRAGLGRCVDARAASWARYIRRSGAPAATQPAGGDREGRRPVQCAGPGVAAALTLKDRTRAYRNQTP